MLRYLTAGESHGSIEAVIIEGLPAGLTVDIPFIDNELKRRMHGYGRGGRMDIEDDRVSLETGCRNGETIGSPVTLIVANRDNTIDSLPEVTDPRPGHADLTGVLKYGRRDCRDILERASARETVCRVAAGALAKLFLRELGVGIISHVTDIGNISAGTRGLSFEEAVEKTSGKDSRLRCADKDAEENMCVLIDKTRQQGDTLGGAFEVIASGVLPGLGSHVQWDRKLDGRLGKAVLSIPAVKAFSIGEGIRSAFMIGSEVHDEIVRDDGSGIYSRRSNNAGGLEGGMSNGMDIRISGYMKPIATLSTPLGTVNIRSGKTSEASTERSDVTAVPACAVIAEAMTALELASAYLEKFGGDSMAEIRSNVENYKKNLVKT
jgi:chorismate synthase